MFANLRSTLSKYLYYLKSGYVDSGERVNPDFPGENFQNHLKVYRFVRQFAVGADTLDVGCGTGYGTAHLAEVARSVVGVDLSKSALRFAKKNYPQVEYIEMDVQQLQFADASFDLIVSSENFEHLPDQRAHTVELARVLRPDGLCFVASPNPEMFIGHDNPFHTKENSYNELLALFSPNFNQIDILENTLLPPTSVGREMREKRWHGGQRGNAILSGLDVTWLHNTHSFFCFLRKPVAR